MGPRVQPGPPGKRAAAPGLDLRDGRLERHRRVRRHRLRGGDSRDAQSHPWRLLRRLRDRRPRDRPLSLTVPSGLLPAAPAAFPAEWRDADRLRSTRPGPLAALTWALNAPLVTVMDRVTLGLMAR